MTKASDNAFPSLLITEGTEPSAPAAGKQRIYIDSTSHHLSATNSSGTERDLESAAGGMATDSLWDAAGDLAQGTGANTGAKLSAGTAGYFLKAGGAATANAWAARELDYVQFTSAVSITATTDATAQTVVTSSAIAYDGATVIMIEFFSPDVFFGTTVLVLSLWDSSTQIGRLNLQYSRSAQYVAKRITPSNASHTYIVKAHVDAGTGGVGAGAGTTTTQVPGFIRITRAL